MHAPPSIVTEPDLVDAAWLTTVLAEEARLVAGLRHEPVGTGLMARSSRFILEPTGEPDSVVIKFPSDDPATRSLGASAYAREVGFYRDLAGRVGGRVPRCHYAAASESGEDFVLVLEDLAPAVPGDQLRGCSVGEARAATANLAHLHASTWGDETLLDLTWIGASDHGSIDELMAYVHSEFVGRFAGLLDEATWRVFARFTERVGVWIEREPATKALVHGDYRLDNLLFHPSNGTVTAVDWQTVDYRSPMRDLAYFLGNSLTVEDRRTHEDALIDGYVSELGHHGVDYRDPGRRVDELRHGMFQGALITMLGAFTASRSDRSESMFAVMADRCASQILDHGALDVLD